MRSFYLLSIIFFVLSKAALFAEMPEHLNTREGIQQEIVRVEDEILKRRAIAAFWESQADRWYFFQITWWQDSITAWKIVDQENERIELMKQEIAILKRLLNTYPPKPVSSKRDPGKPH